MKHFYGEANEAALFLQNEHLCNAELWRKFVDIYRSQPDGKNQGWRGEYWGKMMRGAVLVYEYTEDEALYNTLTDSVYDMMSVAEADGRVSSYSRDTEFDSWDIWSRKYVILACEYYLDICKSENMKKDIIAFVSRCADHILQHIGPDKKEITRASRSWFGVNSSSILEPMVRLYNLTGEKKYLDFATYIVETGGAEGVNIFEAAYENILYPYQYGVSKAYEMTSCFEGLLEYYKVTGIEKYKTAVLNYAKAVLESEMSIIGSSGITHELFDHTKTRQTVYRDGVMQETCVTVTLMKFFSRLLEMTGDSTYADAIEKSFYNAYLGALNTEHKESKYVLEKFADRNIIHCDLPFDSYSPLTPGKRGQKVGGSQIMPDLSYYGCCACIGAAGVGIFLKNAVTVDGNTVTVNFYERGCVELVCNNTLVVLDIDTDYPTDGYIKIGVRTERPTEFTLKLRNPDWSDRPTGYTTYLKEWSNDTIELDLDMQIKLHYPEHWYEDIIYTDMSNNSPSFHSAGPMKVYHKESEDNYVALTRGPLTLAADSRTGKSADSEFSVSRNGTLCENKIVDGVPCLVKMRFTDENGEPFYLVDYAHAGRDWDTLITAWLPTRKK